MQKQIFLLALGLTLPFVKNHAKAVTNSEKTTSNYQTESMDSIPDFAKTTENRTSASIDFLWWQAQEGGTDWAYSLMPTTEPLDIGYNKSVDFPWKPGFRVGIDYIFQRDGWDSNLYYTWYETSRHQNVFNPFPENDEIAGIEPLQTDIQISTEGKINWRILFSMFDYEIGCSYFPTRFLSLRPHIGVKGGWIHQNVHMSFDTLFVDTLHAKKKNHFWGIGPSGGINTKWILGNVSSHYFSLRGDFGGALMWGHFNVGEKETETDFLIQRHNLSKNLIVPAVDVLLGFAWETLFHDNKCRFTLNLDYEMQYWFRQNQMIAIQPALEPTLFAFVYRYDRLSEDLRFHGLTAGVSFGF